MNSSIFLALVCSIVFALVSSQAPLPLCMWGQDCAGQTCVRGTSCLATNIGFPKLGTCVEDLIPADRLATCVQTMDAGCNTNADCCNPAATCQPATASTCTNSSPGKTTCVTGKTCQLGACRERVF